MKIRGKRLFPSLVYSSLSLIPEKQRSQNRTAHTNEKAGKKGRKGGDASFLVKGDFIGSRMVPSSFLYYLLPAFFLRATEATLFSKDAVSLPPSPSSRSFYSHISALNTLLEKYCLSSWGADTGAGGGMNGMVWEACNKEEKAPIKINYLINRDVKNRRRNKCLANICLGGLFSSPSLLSPILPFSPRPLYHLGSL